MYGYLKGRFWRFWEIFVWKLFCIVLLIILGCILYNLCVLYYDDVEVFIDNDDDRYFNVYFNIFVDGRDGVLFR